MGKGSLQPENAVGGGAVADGVYLIKDIEAKMFDYGGKAEAVPAICVTYHSDDGVETGQFYSAGNGAKLHPSGDGKRFEVIGKNSNAFQWIGSILNAGFPKDKVDDDVTVFKGTRVLVESKAQPKRTGLKDQTEGKTIVLVSKILALPGAKSAPKSTPVSSPKVATSTAGTSEFVASAAPVGNSTNGSLDLNEAARTLIMTILDNAPEHAITRVKLATEVMMAAVKNATLKSHMTALKKLAGDASWLVENQLENLIQNDEWLVAHPAGEGWSTDGEEVTKV